MESIIIIIATLVLSALSILLGIGIGFFFTTLIRGYRPTIIESKKPNIVSICVSIIVGILILLNQKLEINIDIILPIVVLILLCYSLVNWYLQRRKAGALLANIGLTSRNKLAIISSLLFALFSSFETWDFLSVLVNQKVNNISIKDYLYSIIYIPSLWILPIFLFAIGLDGLKIRQNGICHTSGLIKWQQIKSFSWDQSKSNLLIIKCVSNFPFLNQEYLTFEIPKKHKRKVDDILNNKLSNV